MEPEFDGDRDEMVAEALGIDVEALEDLGSYEIQSLESNDGLIYGYEIIFEQPIPAGARKHLNEVRTDNSAVVGPNSFDYAGDHWDDDIPWADPQIQLDYEAALGRFLVRFNRIESMIDKIMAVALNRLKRPDIDMGGQFLQRVDRLELVLLAFPTGAKLPKIDIKALASVRNELAHGHFEQNPYDGDYEIVSRKKRRPWSPAEIDAQGNKADGIWHELRSVEAAFLFEPVAF